MQHILTLSSCLCVHVGSVVEVVVTQDNVVHGIFFQDEEMRCMYDRFPEILFVDATYKLNDLRMPLYLFLVEDGNGESEVVATWMVVAEDAISIRRRYILVYLCSCSL